MVPFRPQTDHAEHWNIGISNDAYFSYKANIQSVIVSATCVTWCISCVPRKNAEIRKTAQ